MDYFTSVDSIEELKADYMNYLKKWKNNSEIMAEVNAQYKELLEELGVEFNQKIEIENKSLPAEKQKKHFDADTDRYAEVLNKIIDFNMKIEIIGQWIWCFDSKEYKDQLKELGFWFSNSKKAWVFSGDKKKFIRSHNKLSDLHRKWNYEVIKDKDEA